jgi:hypothetical protein
MLALDFPEKSKYGVMIQPFSSNSFIELLFETSGSDNGCVCYHSAIFPDFVEEMEFSSLQRQ